jgi:hypothetical protein
MKPSRLSLSVVIGSMIATGLMGGGAIAQDTNSSSTTASSTTASSTTASSTDTSADDVTQTTTGRAEDLLIPARGGIGHRSSGAGFDGTTSIRGFIPLRQIPGRNLTYVSPQLLIDNGGDIGGNLLFGHRAYSVDSNRIWGGYLSLDARETDESDFYQLGLGFETLGEVWDFRINGYVPLGDTSQVIDERTFDTGLGVDSGFEGNLLILSSRREQQLIRVEEVALSGFDAEIGARIATWNDGNSDMRGFAGLYFYDAQKVDSTLGWRVGLELRPVQNITLGVTAQGDEIFGDMIVGSIAFDFPRVRPKAPVPDELEVIARMGESVRRTSSIAVDTQESRETVIESTEAPLMNPEEEAAYRFIHVTLGRSGQGDGTIENPFSTVEEAIAASISDGNTIIYVDAGNNPTIPAFTIPDRVSVLSQGPTQFLAGMPFPGFPTTASRLPFSTDINFNEGILVELPFSGDGNLPTIRDSSATNLVTLGDRTVLSGFILEEASTHAIFGNSINDIELRDTVITNPGERGIYLSNVTGSAILLDNRISGAQGGIRSGQAIFIENTFSGSLEASIQRHQLTNNRVGIEILASGNRTTLEDPAQFVEIADTSIIGSTDDGIIVTGTDLGNQIISITNSTIATNGADGIRVEAFNSASQEFSLATSTVTENAGNGLRFQVGIFNGATTAAQENFIQSNTITDNGGDGISIEANEVTAQEFAITGNTISGNDGAGIRAVANNVSFQEFVTDPANASFGLSNNVITNNGDVGIELVANNASTLIADIIDNKLSGNETGGTEDLTMTTTSNSVDACVILDGNVSTTGIQLDNNSGALVSSLFEVGALSTLSTRNAGGITLLPDTSAFTDLGQVTSCFNR